ncbi:long-chain fatty acid--CoA ligase [Blastococcus sp. MG754426]|uniref:class I adenylate-forming enzyme family protein n=1 Tax=unclassified Blastococcus TaxID=2619396 RepID=UPI001EEFE137|nr:MULTISPECIES: AMP-binding protein [unclassified Blastococcus]MCF6506602.1 long-chain fatty acid--CoA ligase [Blastococcus sp. MG754426]MCF6510314.1 long-chain fatty acid--CoA ligase [Blastococcus sp. MG754427]
MDLATALSWTAERHPDRRAVGGPRPMSYRQWDARTNQLARALADLGVRRGDRVGLFLAGGEPLASLHLAAQKLGAVSVPLSTRLGPEELGYCLGDAEAALLVTDETTAPTAEKAGISTQHRDVGKLAVDGQPDGALGDPPDESDISVMLYTSGTTGRPKGVPRSHRAEHTAAVAHLVQTQLRHGEVVLGVMPMFHTMGLRTLLASIVCGGTWVPQVRFDAAESVQLIREEQVSSLYLVPTIYWSLLREDGFAATGVDRLAYAGAAMTPALAEQLAEALNPQVLVNHYGSTEIYTFTIGPDGLRKPGCAGRAGLFSRVRLVEPVVGAAPEALVGPGEQGQVIASMASPEAFGGYWHRPDADEKSIRQGWYYTGDLATADEDGDLWVSGRVDDMINSGGENIYPDEIEAALVRCPAVADVCVVGMPDERWGSVVTAFVVPADGRAPDHVVRELQDYATTHLPSLKRPKRVVAISAIPRSAVGKTLRRALTAGEYESLAAADPGSSRA